MIRIKLPYLSATRAFGQDARDFLQAQLSADLNRIADGEAGFSAYCDAQGKVLALLRVIRKGEEFHLVAARSLRESLIATLGRYVLRAKVRLEPIETTVVGHGAGDSLEYGIEPDNASDDAAALSAWRARELRSGIAWLGPETSGTFLPQMLGFDRLGAVSFRKGCFPGQEVIARVRYLGKVKQLPMLVEMPSAPHLAPGMELELHGQDGPAGTAVVVDSVTSGDETTGLLVARNPEGRAVIDIAIDGRRYPVSVTDQAWATM